MRIAIIGAGITGLAAAIALRRFGHSVTVFEQAAKFRRIGAAICLTPNSVRALDGLGVGAALRATAFQPTHRLSRTWDTGAETSRIELGRAAEEKYGCPQLTTHRADLLSALEGAVPGDAIRLNARLSALEQSAGGVELRFADGTGMTADVVIGADGIHSTVRKSLLPEEAPRFAGMVAYRAIVPVSRFSGRDFGCFTKWWGPVGQSQIVHFLIDQGRELFIFATAAEEAWRQESWSSEGDIDELRASFAGYHEEARTLLAATDAALKTALFDRDPLPGWSRGRVTLAGDAAHPMMPFMAQGAAMGIEDAVVLARCLEGVSGRDVPAALSKYEKARHERGSRIQRGSRENEWLRSGIDAGWVYGYDAWNTPLG
jgi:salicylate hydroxylase